MQQRLAAASQVASETLSAISGTSPAQQMRGHGADDDQALGDILGDRREAEEEHDA